MCASICATPRTAPWIGNSTAAKVLKTSEAFVWRLAKLKPDLLEQRGPGYTPYMSFRSRPHSAGAASHHVSRLLARKRNYPGMPDISELCWSLGTIASASSLFNAIASRSFLALSRCLNAPFRMVSTVPRRVPSATVEACSASEFSAAIVSCLPTASVIDSKRPLIPLTLASMGDITLTRRR